MLAPPDWKSNARDFASWVDRTSGAAQEAVRSSARRAESDSEQVKQQVKEQRDDSLEKLSAEVAQSETARNLINLLI